METGYLTWAQIQAAYPDQWVLIQRPTDIRRSQDALGGHVLACATDPDDIDRALARCPQSWDHIGVHTGPSDSNLAEIVVQMEYLDWRESIDWPAAELPAPVPPPWPWWRVWG